MQFDPTSFIKAEFKSQSRIFNLKSNILFPNFELVIES
jgi:hypothetical protein